jgi:hypothetical protein
MGGVDAEEDRLWLGVGRLVRTLVNGVHAAGPQTTIWIGTDRTGEQVEGGVYFCRLRAGGQTVTKRVLLVR